MSKERMEPGTGPGRGTPETGTEGGGNHPDRMGAGQRETRSYDLPGDEVRTGSHAEPTDDHGRATLDRAEGRMEGVVGRDPSVERDPSDRDPEAIRRDIRQTRGEMGDTVDELADRMSVGRIAEDLWQRVKGEGGDVGRVLQEHPIPVALMGLGLGWLAIEQATGRSASTHSTSRTSDHRGGLPNRSPGRGAVRTSPQAHREKGMEGDGDTDEHDSDGLSERFSEMSERVSEKTSEAGEKVQHLKHQAREQAQEARRGLKEIVEENPLVLGGIVFGLGLASGLSVPSTRFEDEHIGEVSDELKQEAREKGKQGAESVRESGRAVADAALEESRSELDKAKEEARSGSSEGVERRYGGSPERTELESQSQKQQRGRRDDERSMN